MNILIDTREKKPLSFNHPYIEAVRSDTLCVGDYGCEWKDRTRPNVFFERKSIGDLFNSVGGKGYPRFKRELVRAKDNGLILILIIEEPLSKVLLGYKHSTIKGITMVTKLFTLMVRYGLQVVFMRNREEVAEFITQYFLALGRERLTKDQNHT